MEYSAAASGMRSRRLSSLRACASASSGMFALVIASSSSASSARVPSSSPSSFWIVFICSRRMYSRWRLSTLSLVCSLMSRVRRRTSIAWLSICRTLSSRALTSIVSRISCFSSTLMSMKLATRSAPAAGVGIA